MLTHAGPTVVHTASAFQVQAADPADPVQVWYALGHVAGGPYAQQPLVPRVHVARPPDTHEVWPEVQLLVQVSEQSAVGAVPEHDCEPGHVEVDATYGQLLPSIVQVASVCPSWQTAPACAQMDDVHAHEGALPPVHAWCAPHVDVVTHCVQPFA